MATPRILMVCMTCYGYEIYFSLSCFICTSRPLSFYSVICFYYVFTSFPTVNPCNVSGQPLGLESGALPNSAFSESSCHSESYCSQFGRLNSGTAWFPNLSNRYQWMRVQFESSHIVTAITTQGRNKARQEQWVTSYAFSSSFDNMAWTLYLNVYSGSVEVIENCGSSIQVQVQVQVYLSFFQHECNTI